MQWRTDVGGQNGGHLSPRVAAYLGILLHLLLVVPLLFMGIVAPLWGVGLLLGVWLLLLLFALRLLRRNPQLVLLVPVPMIVFTIGLLTVGDHYFGWTA